MWRILYFFSACSPFSRWQERWRSHKSHLLRRAPCHWLNARSEHVEDDEVMWATSQELWRGIQLLKIYKRGKELSGRWSKAESLDSLEHSRQKCVHDSFGLKLDSTKFIELLGLILTMLSMLLMSWGQNTICLACGLSRMAADLAESMVYPDMLTVNPQNGVSEIPKFNLRALKVMEWARVRCRTSWMWATWSGKDSSSSRQSSTTFAKHLSFSKAASIRRLSSSPAKTKPSRLQQKQ